MVERGWTTVEFLVASLILLLTVAAARQQLSTLRRVERRASLRSESSQTARAASMRMRRSISQAGLAVRSDGSSDHPDEPIEGAWSGGFVLRGDMDRGTSLASVPEASLGGAAPYEDVTTGNDEIVGWFLGGQQGHPDATEQVSFVADVAGVPRDALNEEITISRVSLGQLVPPYTLYRVHVRSDSTSTRRRPVIDDVRRLSFEYFDASGHPIVPPGGGEEIAAREARGRIRSIVVSMEIGNEAGGGRESGEPPQRWRFVVTPPNLALQTQADL